MELHEPTGSRTQPVQYPVEPVTEAKFQWTLAATFESMICFTEYGFAMSESMELITVADQ